MNNQVTTSSDQLGKQLDQSEKEGMMGVLGLNKWPIAHGTASMPLFEPADKFGGPWIMYDDDYEADFSDVYPPISPNSSDSEYNDSQYELSRPRNTKKRTSAVSSTLDTKKVGKDPRFNQKIPNIISSLRHFEGMMFESFEEVEALASETALEEGFKLYQHSRIYYKDSKVLQRVYLQCHRGISTTRRGLAPHSPGTKCSFRIQMTQHAPEGTWSLAVQGVHNHPPMPPEDLVPKRRTGLPKAARRAATDPTVPDERPPNGAPNARGFATALNGPAQSPSSDNGYLQRPAPPFGSINRRLQSLGFQVEMGANAWTVTDKIFFAPKIQRDLLQRYGHVLVMGSVYQCNKYDIPLFHVSALSPFWSEFKVAFAYLCQDETESYVWALYRVKNLYSPQAGPITIVSAMNAALESAIRAVFPHANHVVSTQDIENSFLTRIKDLSYDIPTMEAIHEDWMHCLAAGTKDQFSKRYSQLKATYKHCDKLISYLDTHLFPRKQKYIEGWLKKVPYHDVRNTRSLEEFSSYMRSQSSNQFGTLTQDVEHINDYCTREMEKLMSKVQSNGNLLQYYGGPFLFSQLGSSISIVCQEVLIEEYNKIYDVAQRYTDPHPLPTRVEILSRDAATCRCKCKIVHYMPCQHFLALRIMQELPMALDDIADQWRILDPLPQPDVTADAGAGAGAVSGGSNPGSQGMPAHAAKTARMWDGIVRSVTGRVGAAIRFGAAQGGAISASTTQEGANHIRMLLANCAEDTTIETGMMDFARELFLTEE